MKKINTYKDLVVWNKSVALAKVVYQICKLLPPEEKYALADQLKRAAISVASNIAEGYGRHSTNDYKRFLSIALGSVYEIETQLQIAFELQMINKETFSTAIELAKEVNRMIYALKSKLIS
jgi:four helix bundle protein